MGSIPNVFPPVAEQDQAASVELFRSYCDIVVQHLERSVVIENPAQCTCGWKVSAEKVKRGGEGIREHILSHIKKEALLCPLCQVPRRKLRDHFKKFHPKAEYPSEFPPIRKELAAEGLVRLLACFPQFFQTNDTPAPAADDDPDWEIGVCENDYMDMVEMAEKYTFYQREVAEAVKAELEVNSQAISCYACDTPFEPGEDVIEKIEKHVLEHLEATPFRCQYCKRLVSDLRSHVIQLHHGDPELIGVYHIRAKLASQAFENLFECFPGFFDVLDRACPVEERPKSPAVTFTIIESPIFIQKPFSQSKRNSCRKPGTPYPEIMEISTPEETTPDAKRPKISSRTELRNTHNQQKVHEEMAESEEVCTEDYNSEIHAMETGALGLSDDLTVGGDSGTPVENSHTEDSSQIAETLVATTVDPIAEGLVFPKKKSQVKPTKTGPKPKKSQKKRLNNTVCGIPEASPKKPKRGSNKRASIGALRKGKKDSNAQIKALKQTEPVDSLASSVDPKSSPLLPETQISPNQIADSLPTENTPSTLAEKISTESEDLGHTTSSEVPNVEKLNLSEASFTDETERHKTTLHDEKPADPQGDDASESENPTSDATSANTHEGPEFFEELDKLLSENKKLICQINECGGKIGNADSAKVQRHLTQSHKLKTSYVCSVCAKKFVFKPRLLTHMGKSHPGHQEANKPIPTNNEELLEALRKFQALI